MIEEGKRYKLVFVIDGLPKMSNQLLGAHYRVRSEHAKRWKELTARAVYLNGRIPPRPLDNAALELIRISSKAPDYDGAVSGFKSIIDGLVACGVLINDTMKNIRSVYRWEQGAQKEGKVKVTVVELTPEEFLDENFKP